MALAVEGSGIDLADLKAHLGLGAADIEHDDELPEFLSAAEGMVRDWSTEVASAEVTEVVTAYGGRALLSRYPVTSVAAVGSVSAYDRTVTALTDITGYPIVNADAGIINAPVTNGSLLSVTYTAGEVAPSSQFRLAVLEAAAFLWRGRKGGSESYLPAGDPDDGAQPLLLGGLKRRVLLILADKAKGPSIA